MKTEIKEIKKAAITETYEGETVFIEIEEEIKGDKRTAAINAPLPDTIDGKLVEFTQPNVRKGKEMNEEEKKKVIEEIQKELF